MVSGMQCWKRFLLRRNVRIFFTTSFLCYWDNADNFLNFLYRSHQKYLDDETKNLKRTNNEVNCLEEERDIFSFMLKCALYIIGHWLFTFITLFSLGQGSNQNNLKFRNWTTLSILYMIYIATYESI